MLPPQVSIYEINTWVWLSGLSQNAGLPIDLSSVPSAEWDKIAQCNFNAVWLMGVWQRSPVGIAIANGNPSLLQSFHEALPGYSPADNVGSAFCVRSYEVDPHLGGPAALAKAREELAARGMRLILDFVPNHVAPDCPAIISQPGHFLQGSAADLQSRPEAYIQLGTRIFAFGKDPFFPPWPDVIQVNAFASGFQQYAAQQLLSIAEQCDGVRCDMAMLLIRRIFAQTWGSRAGAPPSTEYWPSVIADVKKAYPQFLFIAEAYWDLELELQQQGFDYCYDKKLYDHLAQNNPEALRLHLSAGVAYQQKLVRFLENHDEPRAATEFPGQRGEAAAIVISTVPGGKLCHEGQLSGRRVRVPAFLGRRPSEPDDQAIEAFYRRLFSATTAPAFREGEWSLCPCTGWPDNTTFEAILAWTWTQGSERNLVLVNLSSKAAQARVHLPWRDLAGKSWRLADHLSQATYDRGGGEMQQQGLYIDLAPWAGQILSFQWAQEP